jgi:hypothetical protein
MLNFSVVHQEDNARKNTHGTSPLHSQGWLMRNCHYLCYCFVPGDNILWPAFRSLVNLLSK